jgi:hypothetical protein
VVVALRVEVALELMTQRKEVGRGAERVVAACVEEVVGVSDPGLGGQKVVVEVVEADDLQLAWVEKGEEEEGEGVHVEVEECGLGCLHLQGKVNKSFRCWPASFSELRLLRTCSPQPYSCSFALWQWLAALSPPSARARDQAKEQRKQRCLTTDGL